MNQDKIENARELVKNENETPIFFGDCKIIKNAVYKKKRLIILTERHLFYFSRYLVLKKKFNLLKIDGITIDKKQIAIDFTLDYGIPNQIKISLPKDWGRTKDNLADKLFYIIQHLLTNPEINRIRFNIEIDDMTSSQERLSNLTLKSYPSYYGAFCHLQSLLENPEVKLEIFDEIRIRFLIFFHKKLVDLTTFTRPESASKILLEILPLCPSFKYLSIRQFENTNIYQYLNEYTEYMTTIENISIDGDATDLVSFNNFLKKMRENLSSKMVGLSFKNSNFSNDHLNSLIQYISARKIQSLEFQSCFSDKTVFQYFHTNFLTTLSQFQHFTSLYLEDIESINFDALHKYLPPQLKSLSIVNCNVLIDQVFNTLNSKSGSIPNLSVLNLSYNTFNSKHKTHISSMAFTIPTFLTVIILDNVTFPYGVLVPFLSSLFRAINNDTDISLVHMISSEDDIANLDSMFARLVSEFRRKKIEMKFIRSLKWDFNPISSNFISFLELQTSLLSLSVSGCYCPKDSDGFDDFCRYISRNRSITKLVCRRFNQISLESLTSRLIEAVGKSKINYLDISNSRGGSLCYDQLKSLISFKRNNGQQSLEASATVSNLRCLIFDGLRPYSKEQLLDFVQFIDNDEFSCRCSFPIHDIEYLFKTNDINFGDIYRIISHSMIKTREDYIRPFSSFYKENQKNFPFYFTEENEFIHPPPQQDEQTNGDVGTNKNADEDFFLEGNDFEVSEKADEIEIKPSVFFGKKIAMMGPISSSISESSIFSCKSDDEAENEDDPRQVNRAGSGNRNNHAARKISIMSISKYRNSKQEVKDELNDTNMIDDFTLIIDEEEELLSDEPQQVIQTSKSFQACNKGENKSDEINSKRRQTDDLVNKRSETTNQDQSRITTNNRNKSINQDQSNNYSKSRNNQLNNKNKPINQTNSSSINKQSSKTYSTNDDTEYYSNSSNADNKKPNEQNKTSQNKSKQTNNNNDGFDYDYSESYESLEIPKQTKTTADKTKKPPVLLPNRNRPAVPLRNMARFPVISRRPINPRFPVARPINNNLNANKKPALQLLSDSSNYYYSDYDEENKNDGDYSDENEGENLKKKNQTNTKIEKNDKNELDVPPLLSIDTDPDYNNLNVVTMAPEKKYEDLKNLQTDSDSSYESYE